MSGGGDATGLRALTPADRRVARLVFAAFTLAYVLLTRGHFITTDEVAVYQTAQSIWEDGDLSVGPCSGSVLEDPDGHWQARYGLGQAVLALPLVALGRAADAACVATGADSWRRVFMQQDVHREGVRWSGETAIFFVMLLPCIAGGLLCAGFWLLARRFGASRGAALAGTLVLGLASHPATFAGQFFQHALEAALILWAFVLLADDAAEPSWRSRAASGCVVAVLLLTRIQGLLALPWLGLYVLAAGGAFTLPLRAATLLAAARRALAFAIPVALGMAGVMLVNLSRFGSFSLTGGYAGQQWERFPADGFWGLLFSPGMSVFLFTPALVLAVGALPALWRRLPREAAAITGIAATYLAVHGAYHYWHGHICIGPRYLAAVVPLVLLALPPWLDAGGRLRRAAVAVAFVAGLLISLSQFLVNYWKVMCAEHLNAFDNGTDYLFVPSKSPLLGHARALMAWDERVEFWLRECWTQAGPAHAGAVAAVLLLALGLATWRLVVALRLPNGWTEPEAAPARRRRAALVVVAAVIAATAGGRWVSHGAQIAASGTVVEASLQQDEPPDPASDMKEGVRLLRTERRPEAAMPYFQRVLATSPAHYGASYQLACALDSLGRHDEARPYYETALDRAEETADAEVAAFVASRLAAPERATEDVMQQGMQALYERKHPRAALVLFRKVLERMPEHYGAGYQLAVALDRTGRRAEARTQWEKVLTAASALGDAPTILTATKRLAEADAP